jgi:hypothetical protein
MVAIKKKLSKLFKPTLNQPHDQWLILHFISESFFLLPLTYHQRLAPTPLTPHYRTTNYYLTMAYIGLETRLRLEP